MLKNDRPINQQLRSATSLTTTNLGSSLMSIDEQIAALQNDDTDNSNTDESESEDEHISCHKSCTLEETDDFGNVLKLVSVIDKEEKIVPLGKEFLPGIQCSKSKKFSRQKSDGSKETGAKRMRFNESDVLSLDQSVSKTSSGLEATVRELLRNYEPASLEKRPFYCRVCKFQGQTTDELDAHRLSDFHQVATDMERKMSFCKLCRKQFTSPDQLKEHLSGKGHTERLERMKLNNITRKKFC
jgi:hypothetical protein